jgi:tripartite ATP-independent transporter DctM subunit
MSKLVLVALFGIFIVCLLISTPVIFSMGLGSAASYLIIGQELTVMIRRMVASFKNFNQLAIPYFILAGYIMAKGGVSERIFRFARACVGHITGGLANVNVLASMIFAGISGSAIADVGGLGYIEIKEMTRAGYDRGFSTAITLASCVIGPIIPPSIHMVLYAVIAQVSIARLFIAGILPGMMIGVVLMATNVVLVKSGRVVCPLEKRKTFREIFAEFKGAILSLAAPIIIILGIGSGFTTPTEAGVLAILYSLLVTFVYRDVSFKELVRTFEEAILSFSAILVLVSISMSMGWIFTATRTPHQVAAAILNVSRNPFIVLLIINGVLIILGYFLDPLPILLITTPIFVPLVQQVGVNLVQFGVLMSYTTLIGLMTPPAAVGLYVAAKTGGISYEETLKSFMPFFVPLVLAALIISFLPQLSLWLPNLLFGVE